MRVAEQRRSRCGGAEALTGRSEAAEVREQGREHSALLEHRPAQALRELEQEPAPLWKPFTAKRRERCRASRRWDRMRRRRLPTRRPYDPTAASNEAPNAMPSATPASEAAAAAVLLPEGHGCKFNGKFADVPNEIVMHVFQVGLQTRSQRSAAACVSWGWRSAAKDALNPEMVDNLTKWINRRMAEAPHSFG